MEFTSNGETLKRHWSSHNVDINAGVSEAELVSFEATNGVVLPEDFRDYFLSVNGMPPGVVDDSMIRFWMLDEVKPLSQGARDYCDQQYIDNPESLYLFADYSIWAHAYAIRLKDVPLEKNEVVIIGYEAPVIISKTFSGFVDSYLTDKDVLYGTCFEKNA